MNLSNSPFIYLSPLRTARKGNILKLVSSARNLEPALGRKTNLSISISLSWMKNQDIRTDTGCTADIVAYS